MNRLGTKYLADSSNAPFRDKSILKTAVTIDVSSGRGRHRGQTLFFVSRRTHGTYFSGNNQEKNKRRGLTPCLPLLGHQLPMPTQDRVGRKQRADLPQPPVAQYLALYRQPPALVIVEWRKRGLAHFLCGTEQFGQTTLSPVGRVVITFSPHATLASLCSLR